jgi:hypothetical protein
MPGVPAVERLFAGSFIFSEELAYNKSR